MINSFHFNELLEKDQERNSQVLATEMYKISNGLSRPVVEDMFPRNRNPYILREDPQCSTIIHKLSQTNSSFHVK